MWAIVTACSFVNIRRLYVYCDQPLLYLFRYIHWFDFNWINHQRPLDWFHYHRTFTFFNKYVRFYLTMRPHCCSIVPRWSYALQLIVETSIFGQSYATRDIPIPHWILWHSRFGNKRFLLTFRVESWCDIADH